MSRTAILIGFLSLLHCYSAQLNVESNFDPMPGVPRPRPGVSIGAHMEDHFGGAGADQGLLSLANHNSGQGFDTRPVDNNQGQPGGYGMNDAQGGYGISNDPSPGGYGMGAESSPGGYGMGGDSSSGGFDVGGGSSSAGYGMGDSGSSQAGYGIGGTVDSSSGGYGIDQNTQQHQGYKTVTMPATMPKKQDTCKPQMIPFPVIKHVPVPVPIPIVQPPQFIKIPIDRPVTIDRPVPYPVAKPYPVDRPIPVNRPIYVPVPVPVMKPVPYLLDFKSNKQNLNLDIFEKNKGYQAQRPTNQGYSSGATITGFGADAQPDNSKNQVFNFGR